MGKSSHFSEYLVSSSKLKHSFRDSNLRNENNNGDNTSLQDNICEKYCIKKNFLYKYSLSILLENRPISRKQTIHFL